MPSGLVQSSCISHRQVSISVSARSPTPSTRSSLSSWIKLKFRSPSLMATAAPRQHNRQLRVNTLSSLGSCSWNWNWSDDGNECLSNKTNKVFHSVAFSFDFQMKSALLETQHSLPQYDMLA